MNGMIWVAAISVVLVAAGLVARARYREWAAEEPITDPIEIAGVLSAAKSQDGQSLAEMSEQGKVLAVFLRHAGCTFCREALGDLAISRTRIESDGTRMVLVHMSPDGVAERFFGQYGLGDVDRISDPERKLYRVFGLKHGDLGQLFGWKVWWRGFDAGVLRGHGVGRMEGDGFQMPGVFVLSQGEIGRSFRHQSAADRPNYEALASCEFVPRAEPIEIRTGGNRR